MPPYGGSPDPSGASTPEAYIRALRSLRQWAGQPSLRRLRTVGTAPARYGGCLGELAPSTVSEILNGKRLPRLPRTDFVEAFVRACLVAMHCPRGEAEATIALWLRAWRSLMESDHGSTADVELDAARKLPCLLPRDLPLFVGHDTDIADALRHLRDPDQNVRTVLITGPPGVGKTSLAVRVARLATLEYPDGQLYVDLGGAQREPMEPEVALAIFLAALGGLGARLPESFSERVQVYRALVAHRRLLVVLDNAANAAQIRDLLPSGTGCAVIVTSRTSLAGLDGLRLPVGELPAGPALELLAEMVGADRLHTEPEAAEEIVGFCGGLPMAVWVVGARLAARPHWRLDNVAAALADDRCRLDELTVGDVSVRDSMRLSYDALSPPARRALRLLGLLRVTHFAPSLAATLLDTSIVAADRMLDDLIEVNLLEVTSVRSDHRYRMHELVRLFARERAYGEETAQVRAAARRRMAIATLPVSGPAGGLRMFDPIGYRAGCQEVWPVINSRSALG
jgi:hypothetical protein